MVVVYCLYSNIVTGVRISKKSPESEQKQVLLYLLTVIHSSGHGSVVGLPSGLTFTVDAGSHSVSTDGGRLLHKNQGDYPVLAPRS